MSSREFERLGTPHAAPIFSHFDHDGTGHDLIGRTLGVFDFEDGKLT